jgi:hypothetical protein
MLILDKKLKFVKWHNPKDEIPKLKKDEFFEDDTAVSFVFCQGEKIICMGHYSEKQIQKMIDLGYEMYDRELFGWIDGETKHTQYNDNGMAKLKTSEMLFDEEKEKKRSEILNLTSQEQALLILNINGEKETLGQKLQNIDNAISIEELRGI